MHLKNRLSDVEADCRDRLHVWLLRIVGALTAPTSMALTCRWRSRPQHHEPTHALQQIPLIQSPRRRGLWPMTVNTNKSDKRRRHRMVSRAWQCDLRATIKINFKLHTA